MEGQAQETTRALTEADRKNILELIDELKASKEFPETVKKLMETPEWKEVIEEVYIDRFAKDLVRNYDDWDEMQQETFDAEYKVRSGFLNTITAWANAGIAAEAQIVRYQDLLDSTTFVEETEQKEPTIGVN